MISVEELDLEVENAIAEAKPHLETIALKETSGDGSETGKRRRVISLVTLGKESFSVEILVGRGWREVSGAGEAETVLYPSLHQLLMNRTSGAEEYMKSFHELLVKKISAWALARLCSGVELSEHLRDW